MSIESSIAAFFKQLNQSSGWDFSIFYDKYDFNLFIHGATISLQLMLYVVCLSLLVGVLGAWVQRSRFHALNLLITAFVEVFRNTPPMIQMLFFYFALGSLTPMVDAGGYMQPMVSNFAWAVLSLGLFGGAFNIEIFRSGLDSVPNSTIEGAESLGLSKWQIYTRVTLPLALRTSYPSLANNLISLAKWTSLGYVVGVSEMTLTLKRIWSLESNTVEMMLVLFLFYVTVISFIAWIFHRIERKLAVPGYGE